MFPDSIMPKRLRRETSAEVDGSPEIYNARDYNKHHRELLAIEKALIGVGSNPNAPIGIEHALTLLEGVLDDMTVGGLITRFTGIMLAGRKISIPSTISSTTVIGPLAADATSVTVTSTEGFPSKGYITKINALPMASAAAYVNGNQTFQEVISYSSISGNTFNGCSRGLFGTTAQALPYTNAVPIAFNPGTHAAIISGRATLSYSLIDLSVDRGLPTDLVVLYHEADLSIGAIVKGSSTDLSGTYTVGYALSVIGQYEEIDLSRLFTG